MRCSFWLPCRDAASSPDGLLGGGRREHPQLARLQQGAEEGLDRLLVGCVEHEEQAMLTVDQRLGLDHDAVAGRSRRRDLAEKLRAGKSRAGLGRVLVLSDE